MARKKDARDKAEANPQEKLKHAVESVPGGQQNQGHNARKAALGINTKR